MPANFPLHVLFSTLVRGHRPTWSRLRWVTTSRYVHVRPGDRRVMRWQEYSGHQVLKIGRKPNQSGFEDPLPSGGILGGAELCLLPRPTSRLGL